MNTIKRKLVLALLFFFNATMVFANDHGKPWDVDDNYGSEGGSMVFGYIVLVIIVIAVIGGIFNSIKRK